MNIQISSITKKYGKKQVLKDINLFMTGGECVGILGANGCGKSTLLSILAGIQKPDSGAFISDGVDLFSSSKIISYAVGYVPQGTPLIEELSAKDNLRMWYTEKDLEKELNSGFLRLLGIHDFINVPVRKMSGGMKKRLSIGCAFSRHPPILILDEPGAALDLPCKENIASYLKKCKQNGAAVIIATHEATEIEICDRHFILKDGVLNPFKYDGDIGKLVNSL